MAKKKKKGFSCLVKIIKFIVFAIISASALVYYIALYPNIKTNNHKKEYLYIKTGSSYEDVINELTKNNFINNKFSFIIMSKLKKYDELVKPGRYEIVNGMNNNHLVNILRAGLQKPINLTFNNIRLKEELAGKVGRYIEADSTSLIKEINKINFNKYGINKENALLLFIPNTYEMYWNTNAFEFVNYMIKEYEKFWDDERMNISKKINLSPAQVGIIASIVAKETNRRKEMPTIAGVYINRLKKGMLLQADPTVVFATKEFDLRRVLHKHLEIDSPYNTYKYKGLPPGPICIPEKYVIDAVLNYENHKYIFFCADEKFSGYHNFAENETQHNANAIKYRKALNKAKIK
ncbi:MAG: hypothetical protein A2X12_11460 [Bacteroidetes bacterium GWE2_29_8]|nr:MAG: hypothetical protein A2X12_11460 [Bacteroidetes bacterium GWE2_29_8]OFY13979.1 MAG: hypothetical protein A2X02_09170 [Bacteroidetes bacterium GWF2_29_10]